MPPVPTDPSPPGQGSASSPPAPPTPATGLQFLRFVLESLIDEKEKLIVEEKQDELGTLLTVQVSPSDMGKLIGKDGQTVKALRTLLRVLGGMRNERLNLKILEPAV